VLGELQIGCSRHKRGREHSTRKKEDPRGPKSDFQGREKTGQRDVDSKENGHGGRNQGLRASRAALRGGGRRRGRRELGKKIIVHQQKGGRNSASKRRLTKDFLEGFIRGIIFKILVKRERAFGRKR